MGIDIEKMKKKLAALEKGNSGGGGGNNWFKPELNKSYKVRIVDTPDGDPFKEFHVHYNLGKFYGFLCPKRNFGEECAVCDFASHLWRTKDEEDGNAEMAKSLFANQRYVSPIIVRDEEDSGVRPWGYSQTVYKYFLRKSIDPDWEGYVDSKTGNDFTLLKTKDEGARYPSITVDLSPKSSALSDKAATSKKWLKELPDFDSLFTRKSSEEVQDMLDSFLAGEDGAAEESKYGNTTEDSKATVNEAIAELTAQS